MSVNPTSTSNALLLASFLAGGILFSSGQTQNPQTAAQPAAKKPATNAPEAAPAQPAPVLDTPKAKLSYALGASLGKQFRSQSIDVDPAILYRALEDTLSGGKVLMSDEEIRATMVDLQQKQLAEQKALAERNKKEGDTFLAENKSKEGVVTLPSGLEYKVLKMGDGKKPTASDTVVCRYRGTLINGKEFDSSDKHNGPMTFRVTGVIRGWTEALQLMPVGSKWELFIPSDLAYGPRASGDIGPNSTLIFDIELLSIQEREAPPAKPADK